MTAARLTCSYRWSEDRESGGVDFRIQETGGYFLAARSGELVVWRVIGRRDPRDLIHLDLEPRDVVRFVPVPVEERQDARMHARMHAFDLTLLRARDGLMLPLGRVLLDDENLDGGTPDDPTDDLSAICPECEHEFESSVALVKPCPHCSWSPVAT